MAVPAKSPSCLSPVMPLPRPHSKESWPDFVMKDSCSLLCNFTMNVNSFAFWELYRNGGILDICLSGHCIVTDVWVDLGTLLIRTTLQWPVPHIRPGALGNSPTMECRGHRGCPHLTVLDKPNSFPEGLNYLRLPPVLHKSSQSYKILANVWCCQNWIFESIWMTSIRIKRQNTARARDALSHLLTLPIEVTSFLTPDATGSLCLFFGPLYTWNHIVCCVWVWLRLCRIMFVGFIYRVLCNCRSVIFMAVMCSLVWIYRNLHICSTIQWAFE